MNKTIIIGLILTVVVLFVFQLIDPNTGGNVLQGGISNATQEGYLSVSVTGEVVRTGTYVLNEGDTLSELLMASGGVTSNADARCYTLSLPVEDGASYYIAPLYDNRDTCQTVPYEKVNLNEADKTALMTIDGIGSTIATAIVSYRDEHGEFSHLEQIMDVSGIGNATFEKMKNHLFLFAA